MRMRDRIFRNKKSIESLISSLRNQIVCFRLTLTENDDDDETKGRENEQRYAGGHFDRP